MSTITSPTGRLSLSEPSNCLPIKWLQPNRCFIIWSATVYVPHLFDFTTILRRQVIFSKLDSQQAYHQIPIASDDTPKSAVITLFVLFEYTFMTFRLRIAAQTLQLYINCALEDLPFVFAYIDDIRIASSNPEEHGNHFRIVFDRIKVLSKRLGGRKF